MGLRERRWIKQYQDEILPDVVSRVSNEAGGATLEWEVVWDSFADSQEALENLQYQGLERIAEALRNITKDDLGKEAVQVGLKKIVLKNFPTVAEASTIFKDKVLTINGAWGSGDSQGYPQPDEIQRILEDGL